jgi:hypothetical protein
MRHKDNRIYFGYPCENFRNADWGNPLSIPATIKAQNMKAINIGKVINIVIAAAGATYIVYGAYLQIIHF